MGVTEKICVNYISIMYKSVGLFIEAWLIKICEVGLELPLFFLLSFIRDTCAQRVKWNPVRL